MFNKVRMNGAEALSRALVEGGTEVVFGIPGVHNVALFEALRRSGIQIVAATHEQGAAFMANGYSRATGKPGVFITVPGPGLTNAMTSIAEALVDSTPVLGIVTDVPQSEHRYQMHEIIQAPLVQPIAKTVRTVTVASEIPAAVKQMLSLAVSGEPGPCILEVPSNLYWDKVLPGDDTGANLKHPSLAEDIEAVVARIKFAKRVGLFVGLGAANCAQEVCMLAEYLGAPVATTASGRGVLDESHPLSLGFGWKASSIDSINRIYDTCDLVLAIGVKFSQRSTWDYQLKFPCPLIHVDASSEVLGRNYKTEIAIRLDAQNFLRDLLKQKSQFEKPSAEELLELIRAERENCSAQHQNDASTRLCIGEKELSPQEFFNRLRGLIPSNAILVTDSGYNERLAVQNWLVHEPRTFINPSNFECVGFAIPAAIGAALAFPGRKVVAVVGDGGVVMSGLELMTAVREKLNLTVIILNNSGFGLIKEAQQNLFGASVAVDVGAPDFRALAECIRMDYQPATGGLSALDHAIRMQEPSLLEVKMEHKPPDPMDQLTKRLKNDVKQGVKKLIR